MGLLPLNARPPPPNALPHQPQMSPEGPLPTFCLHVENPKTHLALYFLLLQSKKKVGHPVSLAVMVITQNILLQKDSDYILTRETIASDIFPGVARPASQRLPCLGKRSFKKSAVFF